MRKFKLLLLLLPLLLIGCDSDYEKERTLRNQCNSYLGWVEERGYWSGWNDYKGFTAEEQSMPDCNKDTVTVLFPKDYPKNVEINDIFAGHVGQWHCVKTPLFRHAEHDIKKPSSYRYEWKKISN